MSGTGGIFPNYEDHQLDKKKISEHFAGNFHEIIYPLNYTSKYGPWQYHCPADVKNFIDLNSLTWNGRVKVVNKASTSTPVINGDAAKDVKSLEWSLMMPSMGQWQKIPSDSNHMT